MKNYTEVLREITLIKDQLISLKSDKYITEKLYDILMGHIDNAKAELLKTLVLKDLELIQYRATGEPDKSKK